MVLDIAAEVSSIIARVIPTLAPGESGLFEVCESLRVLPSMDPAKPGEISFFYYEHEIEIVSENQMQRLAGLLAPLAPLELTAAPEILSRHELAEGGDAFSSSAIVRVLESTSFRSTLGGHEVQRSGVCSLSS